MHCEISCVSACKWRFLCEYKFLGIKDFLFSLVHLANWEKLYLHNCMGIRVLINQSLGKVKVDFAQQNILTTSSETLCLFTLHSVLLKNLNKVYRPSCHDGFPQFLHSHQPSLVMSPFCAHTNHTLVRIPPCAKDLSLLSPIPISFSQLSFIL